MTPLSPLRCGHLIWMPLLRKSWLVIIEFLWTSYLEALFGNPFVEQSYYRRTTIQLPIRDLWRDASASRYSRPSCQPSAFPRLDSVFLSLFWRQLFWYSPFPLATYRQKYQLHHSIYFDFPHLVLYYGSSFRRNVDCMFLLQYPMSTYKVLEVGNVGAHPVSYLFVLCGPFASCTREEDLRGRTRTCLSGGLLSSLSNCTLIYPFKRV